MRCSLNELLDKPVINLESAEKIGVLTDIELETNSAQICAIIVAVKVQNGGFFGKVEKVRIDWSHIQRIGKDAVLAECIGEPVKNDEKKSFFEKIWN